MRAAGWTAMALLAAAGAGAAQEAREPWEVYQERRRELARSHPDGPIVLFGYEWKEGQAGPTGFRQERNFYYLTGLNEPEAVLLLLPAASGSEYRETLFLPPRNVGREHWDGPRIDPEDPASSAGTGFTETAVLAEFQERLEAAVRLHGGVYTLEGEGRQGPMGFPAAPRAAEQLDELTGGVARAGIRDTLTRMRMVKSAGEIGFIRKAVEASVEAHLAAWRTIRPGVSEHQVGAAMMAVLLDRGCRRMAYPPIIGAGRNSLILHYAESSATVTPGDVVLIDAGCEYAGYAADITRTAPADGRYSARQREIYNIVLGAQQAAIDACKPGATMNGHEPESLQGAAEAYFEKAGAGLSRYFAHGIGHHVGLDVHDPAPGSVPLGENMVITIEPGLYLPDEGFGVRIEDMALVTADGCEVLSARLPRKAADVEAAVSRKASESRQRAR